jgi:anhydro-N-acetylmuramic acid kinase
MPRERLIAGIMSGTSVDAIDVALVRIDEGDRPHLVRASEHPFPNELRDRILVIAEPGGGDAQAVARLDFELARAYADALRAALDAGGLAPDVLDLIGCHGQTIVHLPDAPTPATLQAGSGPALAALAGVPVVYDFRAADLALGGQGAPLIPFVDFLLFREMSRETCVGILNVGGIANVTLLPAGIDDPAQLVAFDTGPGNMVIDGVMRALTGDPYDRDGATAASGTVDDTLLASLLGYDYFRRELPKSTGREEFGARFVERLLHDAARQSLLPGDVVATAAALTAYSIAQAIRGAPATHQPGLLVVGGGGARNPTLLGMLAGALPGTLVRPIDDFGWPSDAKEAIGFAILADAAVRGVPASLPNVTGAREPFVLGAIAPGRRPRVWPDWIGPA